MVNDLLNIDPSLVSATDQDEYTPLHRASYNNHAPVVEVSFMFRFFEVLLRNLVFFSFFSDAVPTLVPELNAVGSPYIARRNGETLKPYTF